MLSSIKNYRWSLYYTGLLVYAAFYSLAFYPGLETHPGYMGVTFGILHPASFPGDVTGNFCVAMISLQSLLMKIGGDIWLDDRFNLAIWFILLVLSLAGLDKILELFGLKDPLPRLAVLSVAMGVHIFASNIPRVIDLACIRPTTYAGPLLIWITYFLLKGNSTKAVALLALLAAIVSLKASWFMVFVAGLFIAKDAFKWSWPFIITLLATGAALMFVGNYLWLAGSGGLIKNARLFSLVLSSETGETNMFVDGLGAVIYALFVAITLRVRFANPSVTTGLRRIVLISLLTCLAGSLYCTWAPVSLQIPFLLALGITRATGWIQVLIFSALAAWLVLELQSAVTIRRKTGLALLLVLLYQFPVFDWESITTFFQRHALIVDPNIKQKIFVLAALLPAWTVLWFIGRVISRRRWPWMEGLFISLVLCAVVSVGHKWSGNRARMRFLFQHGVLGDTFGSRWVGVNEFFRYETPPASTVMAMIGVNRHLELDTALRIRTGRTMPYHHHEVTLYFNLDKRLAEKEQETQLSLNSEYWRTCDAAGIARMLTVAHHPDYIVLPADSSCQPNVVHYQFVKTINSYAIWRKPS